MKILITGVAGFIGFHIAKKLCLQGYTIIGLDNFCNAYYAPQLKRQRMENLIRFSNFVIVEGDIHDPKLMAGLVGQVEYVIHLAAHANVKYSVTNPVDYMHTNEFGFAAVLESIRINGQHIKHCIYASSSAVYGGNTELPSKESQDIYFPVSMYGASKRANELAAQIYFQTYNIPLTGLRFFTVYGPWGRPDMAIFKFTQNILEGKPIQLFNNGNMRRDFIEVDDVVQGMIDALTKPLQPDQIKHHPIYNLGNCQSENLYDVVRMIEQITEKTAIIEEMPLQSGDPINTYADITLAQKELRFQITVSLRTGLEQFIQWYMRTAIAGPGSALN